MIELQAKAPAAGLLPRRIGTVALTAAELGVVTGVSPRSGQQAQVSGALEKALGVGLPGPNRWVRSDGATAIWVGLNRWLIAGAAVPEGVGDHAALTDLSDAWAGVDLEGPDAAEVLARLTPLDLRSSQFPVGAALRSEVFHMQAIISREGEATFRVLVFGSMIATLVHDLSQAASAVAARNAI